MEQPQAQRDQPPAATGPSKTLATLTVIIPAFNEHGVIADTLERLLEQDDQLAEIIVVDNGSDDQTIPIVQEYIQVAQDRSSTPIRLIHEPRRGVAHARNAGFTASTTELTARIDADTIPSEDWAKSIRLYFASAEPDVVLATGPIVPFDSPIRNRFVKSNQALIRRCRTTSTNPLGTKGIAMAPGANCVLRTAAWETIRPKLSARTDIYEDLDLALCVKESGYTIGYIYAMEAETSARRFRTSPLSYNRYLRQLPETYRAHGQNSMARRSYLDVANNQLVHLLTWIPTRGFVPQTGRFSLRRAFKPLTRTDAARH